MKKLLWLLTLLIFGILATATWVQAGKKIVWKFGHLGNEQHIWHKTAVKFAQLVKAKTNGAIVVKVYPNEQLGKEMELLTMIQSGIADLTISGESMTNWASKAVIMGVPYAFNSIDHVRKIIESPLGDELEQQITDKVGVVPLYYHLRLPRNLTSNTPISKPEDAKGLRMRVPNVPLFLDAWRAVGAFPQVMAFSEVFTGLQQGVIGAQENPYDLIYSASFFEVQQYVNETEHVQGWVYVVLGKQQYASLNKELKGQVDEAIKETQAYANNLFFSSAPQYKQKLVDTGMMINSNVDKDAFRKAMTPAIKKSLNMEQLNFLERINNLK